MLKWKIVSEFDTPTGEHTRFQIRMFGDTFQIKKEIDDTYSIQKRVKLSEHYIVIKQGLLGIKSAKRYFARYIL